MVRASKLALDRADGRYPTLTGRWPLTKLTFIVGALRPCNDASSVTGMPDYDSTRCPAMCASTCHPLP